MFNKTPILVPQRSLKQKGMRTTGSCTAGGAVQFWAVQNCVFCNKCLYVVQFTLCNACVVWYISYRWRHDMWSTFNHLAHHYLNRECTRRVQYLFYDMSNSKYVLNHSTFVPIVIHMIRIFGLISQDSTLSNSTAAASSNKSRTSHTESTAPADDSTSPPLDPTPPSSLHCSDANSHKPLVATNSTEALQQAPQPVHNSPSSTACTNHTPGDAL